MTTHWKAARPRDTHWREAYCREVGCGQYLNGWQTVLPANDAANAGYIRRSGMGFREESEGQLIRFIFEPGQECFKGRAGDHRTPVERDPILWRDNLVMAPLEWLDRMNDDLYQIRARN
jgi:hypothetical protein